jgi:hypothetical protein
MWAYKFVLGQGVHSAMDIDLLDKFNSKYLISNINREQLQEAHKTNRAGITNISNLLYSTLRKPDFLNRMVLFIAQMHKDGCYDAYSLDENNRLKYDWKKDKRFNLFALKEEGKAINLEEYNKQKSLYYSLIRQFNLEGYRNENGEQLNFSDDLPDAYSLHEVQTFKNFADNIYGSYNKSTKAKYEHIAVGRNFMFFSTWMNGIVDNYMKKTQLSQTELKQEQERDYNDNLLFFNEDGTTTTEDTGVPVIKNVPLMV